MPNSYVSICLLLDSLHFGASKSIHKCLAIVSIAIAWCCHSLNIAQFLHIKHGFAHFGDWDCTRAAGYLGGLLKLLHPIHVTGRRWRWLWWRWWWWRHAEIVFSSQPLVKAVTVPCLRLGKLASCREMQRLAFTSCITSLQLAWKATIIAVAFPPLVTTKSILLTPITIVSATTCRRQNRRQDLIPHCSTAFPN